MQCGECNISSDTTEIQQFNNFNISRVNAIQKEFVKLHEMGGQIKGSLLLTLLH